MVPPSLVQQCLQELDFREKGGYAREIITVVPDHHPETTVRALLYRGTPDNPAFSLRLVQDLRYTAAVMAVAQGPSGSNHVYLHQLYQFLLHAKHLQQPQQHAPQPLPFGHDRDSTTTMKLVRHDQDDRDDTYILTKMTLALQPHPLYFFSGVGSNQHGQIVPYYDDDQDFSTLLESFLVGTHHNNNNNNHDQDHDDDNNVVDPPKQLFAGGGHSGLLTQQGQLYLWGWNQHHQCCPAGSVETTAITTVSTHPSTTTTASSSLSSLSIPQFHPLVNNILVETAALGFSHTLVIEKHTGRLLAFGDDSHSQVTGRNQFATTTSSSSASTTQEHGDIATPITPHVVTKEDFFVAVSAGLFHSAAITKDGELVTFGQAKYGQSLRTSNHRWKPPPSSHCKFVKVVCGRHHTAILDDRGRVWTMGDNKFGQLGRTIEPNGHDEDDRDGTPSQKHNHRKTIDPIPQLIHGPFGKDQHSIHDEKCGPIYRCVEPALYP